MAAAFSFMEKDDVLTGLVRTPRNSAIRAGAGSIHDQVTAQKLGFRGGTVAGSLHMEQFPPLLIEAFGDDWLTTGSMSLYFRYATTDGEPVQATVNRPGTGGNQVDIWMDDAAGNRVCDGTASVGDIDMSSAVRKRIAAVPEPQDIRILANVEVGKAGPMVASSIEQAGLDTRLAVITETLDAYTDAGLFGRRIMTPALQVQAMRPGEAALLPRDGSYGVGLFGAIDLQQVNGPALVNTPYQTFARVLAVGETPKTEYYYYESVLLDPKSDQTVMTMLMMIRFMKASSSLWH
ncbi:MAG: hypothetical protein OSB45_04505 [Pseudomonadales bacterium]|jgi:hypothetical protein|nr:hypothetical protein [Pseudomonadales bacterium]